MYLAAIIDVSNRLIVGWSVIITMGGDVVVACVCEAVARHCKPVIFDTDPGSQFAGADNVGLIKSL